MSFAVFSPEPILPHPGPGIFFARPLTRDAPNQGSRPLTRGGRPVTGFLRPATQSNRPTTMEGAVGTARTRTAARPMTGALARQARLGTAAIVTGDSTQFLDVGKLDLQKYASYNTLSKTLFMYLIHVTSDTTRALELAQHARHIHAGDWWWQVMLGFCYLRLGLPRDALTAISASLALKHTVLAYLLLGKVCVVLDQPQAALKHYRTGLEHFPLECNLIAGLARVYEGIGNLAAATVEYRQILLQDISHIEALSSVATEHFYNDEPEQAYLLFRRILHTGAASVELFNNLGLCSFYAQQYDVCLDWFE
jgi:tetratricopeptide repeat protein 8